MATEIKLETPRQDAVLRLIDLSNTYMASLYPAESNHLVDIGALEKECLVFRGAARWPGGRLRCAGGGWRWHGRGQAHVFVDPDARGLRIGKLIMDTLIGPRCRTRPFRYSA